MKYLILTLFISSLYPLSCREQQPRIIVTQITQKYKRASSEQVLKRLLNGALVSLRGYKQMSNGGGEGEAESHFRDGGATFFRDCNDHR